MIVLALLVRLPLGVATLFGLLLVVGHNALDALRADALGWAEWAVESAPRIGSRSPSRRSGMFVSYPLVPWIGVMALGCAAGALMTRRPEARRRYLFALG